jgi:hypothetical protein
MRQDIKLLLPVRDVFITQPFGLNFNDFYQQMGLKAHPGIDFRAKRGCKITTAHDGIVSWCGNGRDGGIGIELWNQKQGFKTFYYHHLENGKKIQKGVKISAGEGISLADNTGKYTTGDHEHFEFYFVDGSGNTLDKGNGYGGSVDPAPYFANRYGKDWDKPAVYHRYGRKRELGAEILMRFKNAWLHRQLKKRGLSPIPGDILTSALVYGNWPFEYAINPAMGEIWQNMTYTEYKAGRKPYE